MKNFGFLKNNKIIRGFRNLSFLTVGMILVSLINLAGYIVILNLIDPRVYGIYSTVGAIVAIFTLFTMNMLSKIVLREGAKDISKMSRIMEKTIGVKIGAILLAMLLCYISTIFLPYEYTIKLYIALFSFELIYQGFNSYLLAIFQSVERMHYVASLNVMNALLRVITLILALLFDLPLPFLFIATLFSDGLTLAITWKLSRKFIKFRFRTGINIDGPILKSMLVFSVIAFLGYFTTQIDVLMISFLSDYKDTGIYTAAVRLIDPVFQYRNLVSIAFFPMFVKMFHSGRVSGKKLFQVSFFLGGIVFTGAIIASILAPPVMAILLPGWKESTAIFIVLVYYTAFGYMILPFYNALTATHNELTVLKIVWIPPIINIFLNFLLFGYFGLIGIAYSTLIVQTASFILHVVLAWTILKKKKLII